MTGVSQRAYARLRGVSLTAVQKAVASKRITLNPDGTIDQAKMRAVSPSTDFSYDFQDLLLRPIK